jgi:hypothetical protein
MSEPSFKISTVEPSGNSQSFQSSTRATTLAPIASATDRASLYSLYLVLPFSSLMALSQTARMKSWKISAWVMVDLSCSLRQCRFLCSAPSDGNASCPAFQKSVRAGVAACYSRPFISSFRPAAHRVCRPQDVPREARRNVRRRQRHRKREGRRAPPLKPGSIRAGS